MEVRGGVGYTEEWSDPRLVRDAHLGSIWEGTSKSSRWTLLRAIRREHCLEALLPVLNERIDRAPRLLAGAPGGFAGQGGRVRARDRQHAERGARAARRHGPLLRLRRRALRREGALLGERGDARRHLIAFLAYVHRLAPRDPLRRVTSSSKPSSPTRYCLKRPLRRMHVERNADAPRLRNAP